MSVVWHGDKIEKKLKKQVGENLQAAAYIVEADAKRLCPVSPHGGRLRSSINTQVNIQKLEGRVKAGGEVGEGFTGSPVEYAAYVELGTVKMSAQPYLRPALEKNRARIGKLLAK